MTETALTFRRFQEGDTKFRRWTEQIFRADASHKCPTYVHRTPPCQGSCPSGHDIRGWLAIARGQDKPVGDMPWQEYAFRRMTEANPFPAVMGRVCPAPCEDGCNRNEVDDHVGINAVEHFIGNWALENNLSFPKPEKETGKKVAVIGGGPGGLSAAYHLRRRGHAVTVFDEHEQLGGMMRYGIPGFRTPRHVLDGEIKRIVDMGVETRMNTKVGRDLTRDDLDKEFDAVFWAVGAQSGRPLPVPGADAPNCITGVAFLRAFNEGRLHGVTGPVVVIGGGDTSIDVATVARRLGHIEHSHDKDHKVEDVVFGQVAHDVADISARAGCDVVLTSLFPVEKMFASDREVKDAMAEGVDIRGGIMPVEVILGDNGRARALKMCECDMDGMKPIPREGTEFEVPCDLVVAAIGQSGALDGLDDLNNGKGFIDADKHFRVKGQHKDFVGGDIIRPHLLTTAIGHGRVAADSIDQFLATGEPGKRPKVDVVHFNLQRELEQRGLAPESYPGGSQWGTDGEPWGIHNYEDRGSKEVIPHDDLFKGHFKHHGRNTREEVTLDPNRVLGNFDERLLALTEEQVRDEGKRCMSCGLCFECDNCLVYCPQTAVKRVPKSQRAVGRYVYTDYARCVGCHICHDVCPTGYIQMGLGE